MESSESSTPQIIDPKTHTNNKRKSHPRRFSDEQIKSLESIFKHETKLEPQKKLQIARDLCLQPKQVSIWFQNKRARWRSKQIEHEFRQLQSNYDALLVKFDDLKREKDSLQMQLQELMNGRRRLKDGAGDDDVTVGGDDGKIITGCFGKIKDQEFIRWSGSGGEEEEMSNLSLFDENFMWWET